ncbi:MAG: response regulator transcription factor [Deltaproteobacteria bacterium]|nr:response regulator transcription factor [Deltaproteobacteria bacterium]
MSILVAEDDPNILTGLVDILESEGYNVATAANGEKALRLFEKESFDLIILDIMMPEISGYDVCKKIRAKDEDTPIIMLTAKGEEIDKVVGLKLGADDYISKPFGVHELLARIQAVIRRCKRNNNQQNKHPETPESFSFGDAVVDTKKYRMTRKGKNMDLSEREVMLLQYFYSHPNEVLSRDQLLNAVWGIDYYGTTRTLDQHIAQLRKKIEKDPSNPCLIKTVHRIGYRYENE